MDLWNFMDNLIKIKGPFLIVPLVILLLVIVLFVIILKSAGLSKMAKTVILLILSTIFIGIVMLCVLIVSIGLNTG